MLFCAKKLIIERFDLFVNQIDIYTEEQLEKYSSTDTVQVPNEADTATRSGREFRTMRVCDYLNKTRDELIEKVRECEHEALRQVEEIPRNLKASFGHTQNAVLRKLLFRIIPCPFILKIHEIKNEKRVKNSSPFNMYLIKLEVNMDIDDASFSHILRYNFALYFFKILN